MFRKKEEPAPSLEAVPVQSRVTSILGEGISWKGEITGEGGLRIEGLFEGVIDIAGLVIVDTKGRVESDLIKAETVIVAGAVRSDIQAKRVEIRSTGRVWGNVTTVRFSTEEGAYLRGKIQMEEETSQGQNAPEASEGDQNSEPALKPKKSA
ncbi:MAG: polymer-forming cytoskeletal protein [Anaerolineales bacterium]|jgi:cytoskeletal protein CcmA (bactofilin family)